MDLWDWSLQKAGHNVLIKAVMSTFHFLFNYFLGKIILKQADNLSKTLKSQSVSAAQGWETAHLLIKMLWKDWCDEKFELFWSSLMNKKQS